MNGGEVYWLCSEVCIQQVQLLHIADTLLGEEAILGENNPPSTAATGLGVGISATGKEVFNINKITKKILVVIFNKISHQRQGYIV